MNYYLQVSRNVDPFVGEPKPEVAWRACIEELGVTVFDGTRSAVIRAATAAAIRAIADRLESRRTDDPSATFILVRRLLDDGRDPAGDSLLGEIEEREVEGRHHLAPAPRAGPQASPAAPSDERPAEAMARFVQIVSSGPEGTIHALDGDGRVWVYATARTPPSAPGEWRATADRAPPSDNGSVQKSTDLALLTSWALVCAVDAAKADGFAAREDRVRVNNACRVAKEALRERAALVKKLEGRDSHATQT